jgi:MYXO-CTERM domain-containing protein
MQGVEGQFTLADTSTPMKPSLLSSFSGRFRPSSSSSRFAPVLLLAITGGLTEARGASIAALWDFNDVANATSSVSSVGGVPGAFNGVATRTAGGGGVSGVAADYALDVGGTNGAMVVSDAGAIAALNAIAGGQALSISYWQFIDATVSSTAFWSTSTSTERGLSAHSPWSDGNAYFDTGGCCGAAQRISGALGATVGTWEHMAFVYDNGTKTIYRGTTVIASAGGAAPLVTDLTNFIVGNDFNLATIGMDAKLDNFTVWVGALTPAEVAVLSQRPVPEPSSLLFGALGLAGILRRRRR